MLNVNSICWILTAGLAFLSLELHADGCLNIKAPIGTYGISLSGHLVDGRPYGASGVASLKKDTFTLNLMTSVGGVISQSPIQGTLTVKDCGLTLSGTGANLGFQLKGQLAERGNEIFVTEINASQPMVAEGALMPIGLANCSNKTLKGEYSFGSQGYESNPSLSPSQWIPTGVVGVARFNGAGCASYTQTRKEGSNLSKLTATLLYTIASDCSVTFTENGVPAFYGVLVNNGDVIPYLQLNPGSARTGQLMRAGSNASPMGCS